MTVRTRTFATQDLYDADFPNMNLTVANEHVENGKYGVTKRCIFQWWDQNGEPEPTVWAVEYEDNSTSPWDAGSFGWDGDTIEAVAVRETSHGRWEPI